MWRGACDAIAMARSGWRGDAMTQAVSPPRTGSLPLGVIPRGLSRVQAAEYIGLSPTKFDELVCDGRMPKPAHCGRRLLWDRRQIDRALDALFNEEGGANDAPEFAL
jgi:predicted DNA-binding transcriptional regulator AlpA